eukprot:TRINITY_DN54729_c0_g1_i1.p1 TRINITY_DN54729_c0_g1~~TRINITY_DN54729_c0_g1_i1.p1  ORF type:complete len:178 (-),score=37.53 TRINITY_DN54729_c0_g1_i1:69-602(-)
MQRAHTFGHAAPLQDEPPSIFHDAHSFVGNVAAEIAKMRAEITQQDESRRAEIQEMRALLEQQKSERRDVLGRLRYEFEEFVHKKIDKVVVEVDRMKGMETQDDAVQQAQIEQISSDIKLLTDNLFYVQSAWGKLVGKCLNLEDPRITHFDADREIFARDDTRSASSAINSPRRLNM